MKLKLLLAFGVLVQLAQSTPMSFRSRLPADEVVKPFADETGYRLPNSTIPIRYDVSLKTEIHRAEAAFSGIVKIRIKAVEPTSDVTLHYRQLTIEGIGLYDSADPPVLIENDVKFTSDDDHEFLVLKLTNPLTVDTEYLVEIQYQGFLRDDNMGFYRSSYKNAAGQTTWLATTQLENTDARHAFPCYDEPAFRAVFGIEIKHDASYEAISNMPVSSSEPEVGTNFVITKFSDTPSVQPYLIAFMISDFKSIESTDEKQRVYARPQSIEDKEAELALDVGQRILTMFEEHLGVPYDLPKMYQVAVPDFDAGAMENWGLVTYREDYLLYNETIATTKQRENVITVIAHEFAVSLTRLRYGLLDNCAVSLDNCAALLDDA